MPKTRGDSGDCGSHGPKSADFPEKSPCTHSPQQGFAGNFAQIRALSRLPTPPLTALICKALLSFVRLHRQTLPDFGSHLTAPTAKPPKAPRNSAANMRGILACRPRLMLSASVVAQATPRRMPERLSAVRYPRIGTRSICATPAAGGCSSSSSTSLAMSCSILSCVELSVRGLWSTMQSAPTRAPSDVWRGIPA